MVQPRSNSAGRHPNRIRSCRFRRSTENKQHHGDSKTAGRHLHSITAGIDAGRLTEEEAAPLTWDLRATRPAPGEETPVPDVHPLPVFFALATGIQAGMPHRLGATVIGMHSGGMGAGHFALRKEGSVPFLGGSDMLPPPGAFAPRGRSPADRRHRDASREVVSRTGECPRRDATWTLGYATE
jgi:hypothetical protein